MHAVGRSLGPVAGPTDVGLDAVRARAIGQVDIIVVLIEGLAAPNNGVMVNGILDRGIYHPEAMHGVVGDPVGANVNMMRRPQHDAVASVIFEGIAHDPGRADVPESQPVAIMAVDLLAV